jgi:hypothetical protein
MFCISEGLCCGWAMIELERQPSSAGLQTITARLTMPLVAGICNFAFV